MGYWLYYGMFALAWFALDHPIVLVPLVLFVLFKRFIPDPWILVRTFSRSRRLAGEIKVNPANVTARRDLASIYLQRLRPAKALEVLRPAVARDPANAECQYLLGVALLGAGQAEEALVPLVESVELDPRVRFGDPYRVAGDALAKLERHHGAIDAYERYVDLNTSTIEGRLKLARAHKAAGEADAATRVLEDLKRTWSVLPGFKRRREWRWYGRALFM